MGQMMRVLAATAFWALGAVGAMAQTQCVGEFDLERGILVEFADGSVTFYQGDPRGLVEITRVEAGEQNVQYRYTSLHGIYFLDEFIVIDDRIFEEGRVRTVFGQPLRLLPTPRSQDAWEGENINIITGRAAPRAETMRVAFGERGEAIIGPCSYTSVEMAIRYDWPEDGFGQSLRFLYFVNIGIGIPLESQFDGQDPVVFRPVDVRAQRQR